MKNTYFHEFGHLTMLLASRNWVTSPVSMSRLRRGPLTDPRVGLGTRMCWPALRRITRRASSSWPGWSRPCERLKSSVRTPRHAAAFTPHSATSLCPGPRKVKLDDFTDDMYERYAPTLA